MRFSCPGKVFLLGEYAVLAGAPALVVAVPPRFELTTDHHHQGEAESDISSFAPASPIGRLLQYAGAQGWQVPRFSFGDPHQESGGFGASTAQFALAWAAITGERDWIRCWSLYRELMLESPSGADLVGQWLGGVTHFQGEKSARVFPGFEWSTLVVFSASRQQGRKVRTHDHLASLKLEELPLGELKETFHVGLQAIESRDPAGLGTALSRYGDILRANGLEIDATHEDRRALARVPGVLGIKGAGALQADAIVAIVRPEARGALIEAALQRDLVPVFNEHSKSCEEKGLEWQIH